MDDADGKSSTDASRLSDSSASEMTIEVAEPADMEEIVDGDVEHNAAVAGGSGSAGGLVLDRHLHLDHPDAPLARNDHDHDHDHDTGSLTELDDDGDVDEVDDDDAPPTPRFLQDAGAWKHWRWVPYPARRFAMATAHWSRGPADARPFVIAPLLPAVQSAPLVLRDRFVARLSAKVGGPRWLWRRLLYAGWLALWLAVFAAVLRHGWATQDVDGWGAPAAVGCGSTYWVPGNQCGLDGSDCRPFAGSGFAFRCPSSCASYHVLNPRAVGDREIVYQTLVVGGPGSGEFGNETVYRGDSFLCSAAIHAGVIQDGTGGCGVVRLAGRKTGFAASKHHEIESVPFDSYFPLTFEFLDDIECPAHDPRWSLLTVSVLFSVVVGLLVAAPGPFFWAVFTGIFWTVGLATDPPPASTPAALISTLVGAYLPAALAAWVIFDKMGVRRTLTGLAAPVEKTVLWLGAAWVGALTNYTFDYIPIARLTPHDLKQQPGAESALAMIISILLCIVATQVWFFRQEGRMRRYLKIYILFCSSLLFCAFLPGLHLRIHHYILALLLLPGTSMQTRPALLYQGLLLGFFINGTCRWGWAPLLQTAAALQGDAELGSPLPDLLPPLIRLADAAAASVLDVATGATGAVSTLAMSAAAAAAAVAAANTSAITFTWRPAPGPRYNGISVLVNDVERYRTFFDDDDTAVDGHPGHSAASFVWERPAAVEVDEYFRFAFLEGRNADDYTKAGVWTAAGEWLHMATGPSRVRSRGLDGESTHGLR